MSDIPWFQNWFDTEYYHLLYNNRDEEEALSFIQNITQFLQIQKGSRIADIACGRGRHTRVLANLGMVVSGFDLSENSILWAKNQHVPNTSFKVHDIRKEYDETDFDLALNLFTSFGYFESYDEELLTLKNIFKMLKPGAWFVQDYLNGAFFLNQMPCAGEEQRGAIKFDFTKTYAAPYIVKNIIVDDEGSKKLYLEKVKVFNLEELKELHSISQMLKGGWGYRR